MLDERRGAMDALAASFTARADDIDGRMRGFAQSIADTVNDTERRLLTARKSMENIVAELYGGTRSARPGHRLGRDRTFDQRPDSLRGHRRLDQPRHPGSGRQHRTGRDRAGQHRGPGVPGRLLDQPAQRGAAVLGGKVADLVGTTRTQLGDTIASVIGRFTEAVSTSTQKVDELLGLASDDVATKLAQFRETADAESQRATEPCARPSRR